MKVLLISTYELGHQPFGLASPAAFLREAGIEVECLDLAVEPLEERAVDEADLVAFYLPMHTATRIAARVIEKVRRLNPTAALCAYGLYAPMSEGLLRRLGVGAILGGEFEEDLLGVAQGLAEPELHPQSAAPASPIVSFRNLSFRVPDRTGLPPLSRYARLRLPDGTERTTGYTEASRGCKHFCRHCPIVPVYEGRVRFVRAEVVVEDVRRQVAAGARHVTFGDPDFFNAPRHGLEILRALHREYPKLTCDVTIKVEHLLKHAGYLHDLRESGCVLVTSAAESVDDRVLALLGKGHTRADFVRAASLCREAGLALSPTFVAFTPWITLAGYEDLLLTLSELELIEHVAPIQLAIRLLIPAGSRLLDLPEIRELIGPYDEEALCYPWVHPDPRVDSLQRDLEALLQDASSEGDRRGLFEEVWRRLQRAMNRAVLPLPAGPKGPDRAAIPYLTEPWYC